MMTDGELLAWLGTDAERWADAFLERDRGIGDRRDWLVGWFANAIEAGRNAAQRGDAP